MICILSNIIIKAFQFYFHMDTSLNSNSKLCWFSPKALIWLNQWIKNVWVSLQNHQKECQAHDLANQAFNPSPLSAEVPWEPCCIEGCPFTVPVCITHTSHVRAHLEGIPLWRDLFSGIILKQLCTRYHLLTKLVLFHYQMCLFDIFGKEHFHLSSTINIFGSNVFSHVLNMAVPCRYFSHFRCDCLSEKTEMEDVLWSKKQRYQYSNAMQKIIQ